MPVRKRSKQMLAAVASSMLLSLLAFNPVQAQYSPFGYPFGYSPLTGSSSLFWPLRVLMSPGSMLWRGGYGYSAPYYLANTLTYNAAYAAGQGINAKARQNYINKYWNQANGINAPVVDQISAAPWYYPPRLPAGVNPNTINVNGINTGNASTNNISAPNGTAAAGGKGGDFMPVPSALADPTQQNSQMPITAPALTAASSNAVPAAPDFRGAGISPSNDNFSLDGAVQAAKLGLNPASSNTAAAGPPEAGSQADATDSQSNLAPASNSDTKSRRKGKRSSAGTQEESNPFAEAFIDHVNKKFSGDISAALSDKQTRGYAQALGVLDHVPKHLNLSPDRIELIRKIMQDSDEDSLTKINTIRMLIKH